MRYELGVERKDRHDRTLAYLTRGAEMHNRALLSEGYAKALTIPPNNKYVSSFEQAEREAKDKASGLWSTCEGERGAASRAAARHEESKKRARRTAVRREREALEK